MGKEYTSSVTLAIYGEDLDPGRVTKIINLRPNQSWKKGDVKLFSSGRSFTHPAGGWKLFLAEEELTSPLEDQLNYWHSILIDKGESILKIKNFPCKISLDCYVSTSNQVSATLDSKIICHLGSLGIDLAFSFFCRDEDADVVCRPKQ